MIYFDSAATSLQKPPAVCQAACRAIRSQSSPGRGGHITAMRAANSVYECRAKLDSFFNVGDPEKVIFTSCATHALNIAIKTLVSPGDTVVITGYEHNAVTRPLRAFGANIRVAESPLFEPEMALEAFRRLLPGAQCAVCTHVSNVFGFIFPIEEIAELCRRQGVPLIIDASQSAGTLPVDFSSLKVSFAAMPGHKGLLGPQGTGVLLCASTADPIIFGGTGSASIPEDMPGFLPDRLEAGTHNVPGISGLSRGVSFLQTCPQGMILRHERELMHRFIERISAVPDLKIYAAGNPETQTGVLSLVSQRLPCDVLAERLGQRGICVRAGMHCAPLAHKTAGTIEGGTVRFSFSPFNTQAEVDQGSEILKKILRQA